MDPLHRDQNTFLKCFFLLFFVLFSRKFSVVQKEAALLLIVASKRISTSLVWYYSLAEASSHKSLPSLFSAEPLVCRCPPARCPSDTPAAPPAHGFIRAAAPLSGGGGGVSATEADLLGVPSPPTALPPILHATAIDHGCRGVCRCLHRSVGLITHPALVKPGRPISPGPPLFFPPYPNPPPPPVPLLSPSAARSIFCFLTRYFF